MFLKHSLEFVRENVVSVMFDLLPIPSCYSLRTMENYVSAEDITHERKLESI